MAARTAQRPTDAPTLVDAATSAPARKPLPYMLTSDPAPVAGGGVVALGRNAKTEAPVLVFQEGRTQQAISIQAVAAALYHGVIPREQVEALHAKAEADARSAR